MKMNDIKAITLRVGHGGLVGLHFNQETGHLRLFINDECVHAPEGTKIYPLSETAANFTMYDDDINEEDIQTVVSS